MFDPTRLFHWSYWFSLTPPPMTTTVVWIAFIVCAAIVCVGVGLRVLMRRHPKRAWHEVWNRAGRACLTLGCLALLLLFFSFERIRLFGSRFWYLLWLLGALVWAAFIFHYATRVLPRVQEAEAQALEKAKYLPKRRQKK